MYIFANIMIDLTTKTIDEISETLKEARRNKDLTQTDVAKLVGLNKTNISLTESKPDRASLGKIIKHLNAIGSKLYLEPDPQNFGDNILTEVESLINKYKQGQSDSARTLIKINKLFKR